MARITVEDCIVRVPNRFELIMLAAQRARELSKGVPTTVEVENDKSHVIALREIAEGTIDPAAISEAMLDALSGIDHDDAVMDEPEDRLFEMEAPSAKFDFDQAIRDWEREGEDEDSKEGAADADPANWEQGNPEGIARQPRPDGDLSDDAMDAANEDDGGSTLAEQA